MISFNQLLVHDHQSDHGPHNFYRLMSDALFNFFLAVTDKYDKYTFQDYIIHWDYKTGWLWVNAVEIWPKKTRLCQKKRS